MKLELVYPSFEAVLEAHIRIIRKIGGQTGSVNASNLKYILETVHDIGEESENAQKVIKRKAAYMMYNMVVSHPFLDGNKRSAFEITKRFLELNGWVLAPRDEDAFNKLVSIANGTLDQEDVEEWIGNNLRKE